MNRIYSVIYSEAKNGYVVVSELARRHGKQTHSRRGKAAIAAAVLTALASVSCTGMPIAQAEVLDKPMTVVEKDTAIEKDVDVTIQAGYQPFHAIKIDKSASGGTIQINSKKITAHIQGARVHRSVLTESSPIKDQSMEMGGPLKQLEDMKGLLLWQMVWH